MPLDDSNGLEYWGNSKPKCPHCDHECDISALEWWDLYDTQEGEHEKECPKCDKAFTISARCEFSFSTDEQPEPDSARGDGQ